MDVVVAGGQHAATPPSDRSVRAIGEAKATDRTDVELVDLDRLYYGD